jgi:hypothetical protein
MNDVNSNLPEVFDVRNDPLHLLSDEEEAFRRFPKLETRVDRVWEHLLNHHQIGIKLQLKKSKQLDFFC